MKVAIIGLGGMGSTHYNLIRDMDDAEIVALVDAEESRILEKASQCGARPYTDIHEMLAKEKPDFADICTPSYLHFQHAVAVMEKGVHVLTEKPAALCADDVKAMLKCAGDNNVMFMAAHVLRFWPEYIWLKNAVDGGDYGKLLDLNMWRLGQRPMSSWRNWMMDKEKSGLVPFDLHIHDIDFMVWLLGAPGKSDYYEITGSAGHFVETACHYEGTRVRAKAAWFNNAMPFQMGYEALFERGFADFSRDTLTLYPNGGEPVIPVMTANFEGSEINVANTSGYYNEIRYFMDCIRKNEKPSIISGDELITTLNLLRKGP
ncbi:MAG: Gfo/Idh/MocA family oxidoreductase [Defluviitaleaceae bacterium]|nr:Gfo/Idh/MocA family oxidoreductase [Defluviitaleaceae bacterium]MCL2835320.1 Gfo/Idh/MocA family oxidoreductase [Defluviitaleaceae bacterium]